MKITLLFILGIVVASCSNKNKPGNEAYFGENLPGNEPQLFAPGFVNDGIATRDITFTPDGDEVYFGKNIGNSRYATILYCKNTKNGWTKPEVVSFARDSRYIYIEPCISPDGKKLFFVSNMGQEIDENNRFITDIWVADRVEDDWGTPYKLDTVINSPDPEFYPSVAANGNLYFTREDPLTRANTIYKSVFKNGTYQKPIPLSDEINCGRARFNTTIATDESFMIIPCIGMPDSYGGTDYYISFFNETKGWSIPQNMGEKVNSATTFQYSASFSPDGNFMFFMSTKANNLATGKLDYKTLSNMHNAPESGNSNIYWIDASFIDTLKQKATFIEN